MIARSICHINENSTAIKESILVEKSNSNSRTLVSNYSLISTGTERLVLRGTVPREMYQHMKVPYMKGNFDFPISYGYSLVASDEESAYHVMHPHQSIIQVTSSDLFKLESSLPTYRSPLISNMETVLNAIWDADLEEADKIGICGFGNIGSLLALTLKLHYSKDVFIIESDDWRCLKAQELGFEIDNGVDNYNVIFHTSASENGLQHCINHLDDEGRVIELSWYGNKQVNIKLGSNFHYKRLRIIGSQVSKIPKKLSPEMTYLKRKRIAAEMLKNEEYDKLISEFIEFEKAPAFYNDLRNGQMNNGLIWMIKY